MGSAVLPAYSQTMTSSVKSNISSSAVQAQMHSDSTIKAAPTYNNVPPQGQYHEGRYQRTQSGQMQQYQGQRGGNAPAHAHDPQSRSQGGPSANPAQPPANASQSQYTNQQQLYYQQTGKQLMFNSTIFYWLLVGK